MIQNITVNQQYRLAKKDEFKILIVGAGMAGLTTAQMLRKQGKNPVLIERHKSDESSGYMLALMPMVDNAMSELNVTKTYLSKSVPIDKFNFYSHQGSLLRKNSIYEVMNKYGTYRGVSRGSLIEVLTDKGCTLTYDTKVSNLYQKDNKIYVSFERDEDLFDFDLIIISDGINSSTRNFIVDKNSIDRVDTQWGGWIIWNGYKIDKYDAKELYGEGFFIGSYPVKNNVGVFIGGPESKTQYGTAYFTNEIRDKLNKISPELNENLNKLSKSPNSFYWSLKDCRCERWHYGNAILLGDAATGFLPTAGIGASMAIESAWLLTSMLKEADIYNLKRILKEYEKIQRPRVEKAQTASRNLAKLMFNESGIFAHVRDYILKYTTIERGLKSILKLIENQPKL